QRDLRDDAECALRADHDPGQIVAGRIQGRAAELHHVTVGEHHAHPQHVIHGESVLEAMRATGVLSDIAADGADLLARWVGRVVKAIRRDTLRHGEVDDTRLYDDAVVHKVDGEYLMHAREHYQDAAGYGERATGEAGTRATRHERDALAP